MATPSWFSRAMDSAASLFGRIDEHEVPQEVEGVLVGGRQRIEFGRAPGGDGHDACTGAELRVEHPSGLGVHVDASVEYGLGRTLRDERAVTVRVVHEDRDHAPLVVEGDDGDAAVLVDRCSSGDRRFPQRHVERVPADSPAVIDRRLVAHQPGHENLLRRAPPGIECAVEADLPLRERARLVGEQHLDVAEVLDAHQPLHEHLLAGEPP